ncbi:MAG: TIGR00730 family Rossman fold protein [Pseudomonadota bacterium]
MSLTEPRICVYCGSRTGRSADFTALARETGRRIAGAGCGLVYGAGDNGLMGEVARAALGAGGPVIGFIPRHLVRLEVAKSDLSCVVVTETMHERKKLMFENADAVLALPGGTGTLDELVEVLTWRHLGLHAKPLVLLDHAGYWQPFLGLLEHMAAQGFADLSLLEHLTVVPDAAGAIEAIATALSLPGGVASP